MFKLMRLSVICFCTNATKRKEQIKETQRETLLQKKVSRFRLYLRAICTQHGGAKATFISVTLKKLIWSKTDDPVPTGFQPEWLGHVYQSRVVLHPEEVAAVPTETVGHPVPYWSVSVVCVQYDVI